MGWTLVPFFGILHVKNYNNLPPELKPAVEIPAPLKMQLVVTANPDGTHHVLKFFHFMRPTPVDIAKSICVGEVKSIQTLSVNPTLHKKSAQWLLEQMGGLQLLWFCLTPPPAEIAEMVDIDKGFDFIEEKAPRDSTGTKQLRWITKWTCKENTRSPIQGYNDLFLFIKCIEYRISQNHYKTL